MSAGPPISPNVDVHDSRQPELYAATITTYILALGAVALRFWARKLMKTSYWIDDWIVVAAQVLATGQLGSELLWIHQGYGQHYELLGKDFVSEYFKNLFTSEILYALIICLVKLSILAFYLRLFTTSIRIPCYILGAISIGWALAIILVTTFQCDPISGFWDRTIPAKCNVNYYAFFVGISVPNILTDAILLALPMPYIWKLQRSTSQKIVVAGVFMLGGFVTIISIARLISLVRVDLKSPDLDWNFAYVGIWTVTETNMAIVSACLPSLRPILSLVLYGNPSPARRNSRSYTSDRLVRRWKYPANSASHNQLISDIDGKRGFVPLSKKGTTFSLAKPHRATIRADELGGSDYLDVEMQRMSLPPHCKIGVRNDLDVNWTQNN